MVLEVGARCALLNRSGFDLALNVPVARSSVAAARHLRLPSGAMDILLQQSRNKSTSWLRHVRVS